MLQSAPDDPKLNSNDLTEKHPTYKVPRTAILSTVSRFQVIAHFAISH